MPYKRTTDLPKSIKDHLPKEAQEIYLKAFNNAHKRYVESGGDHGDLSSEDVSFKVAWASVKKKYEKAPNGHWVKKH